MPTFTKPEPPPKADLTRPKRGTRYPWPTWFKPGRGQITLVQGKDYPATIADIWMLQSIWRQARRTGVKVSCSVTPGKILLTVVGKRKPVPDPRGVQRAKVRAAKKLKPKGKK